ncbi:MBL fold metallo-hydrolase [Amorphus coralli]|uniref:MBL fold metallo-hydrolase n=1 Tax=Amorphus coralli TaxID=340680 RepID=UPI00035D6737|nr:MBL fold metallo-hydrolase [Amorphus coralli]
MTVIDPRDDLRLTFWGVRGSIPTPGEHTLRYGGETTCLEIQAGPHLLIIDCGSGARRLGWHMDQRRQVQPADLLFTHFHLDHICGLPFFCPAYSERFDIKVWAGHVPRDGSLEEMLARLMSPPLFPVPTTALRGCQFRRFTAGEAVGLRPGLTVKTIQLNHPGGATGYRIEWGGGSIVTVTDHEHGNPEIDAAVARFVEGADIMVYDATYRDEEYGRYVGWGHSTWQKAVALADKAGVRHPVMFHHDPCRTDDDLDRIAEQARARHPGAIVARQGLELVAGAAPVEAG